MNDFVILTDRHGMLSPDDDDVRFLCQRRSGLGADGMLRAIKAGNMPEWDGDPDLWFMDYRNADGSIAEMCGNGIRVFAHYLLMEGLISGSELPIATRAGLKTVELVHDNIYRADLGPVTVDDNEHDIENDGVSYRGRGVDVGNPHSVVDADDLGSLRLDSPPSYPTDRFPHGVNVEFVHRLGPDHIAMRVHERGVGETMSCGTGTVAAAAGTAARDGRTGASSWTVDVPGGRLQVELTPEGRALLIGPADIVCRGEVFLPSRPRHEI